MRRVTIHQPSYLPWLGFFGKVLQADVLVFLDTVQFKKHEYQNRNRIRTANGWQWLTVPVLQHLSQSIAEVRINPRVAWSDKHCRAIHQHYGRAPYTKTWQADWQRLISQPWTHLSPLNIATTRWLLELLGIDVEVHLASELPPARAHKTARLVDLCRTLGATTYISGAQGKEYMDLSLWEGTGVEVVFHEYRHPVYTQVYPGFEPYMAVLDLLAVKAPREARACIASGNRNCP